MEPSLRPPASVGQLCFLLWRKDPFLPYQGTLPSPHTRALSFVFIDLPGQCSAEEDIYCPPTPNTHTFFTRSYIEPIGVRSREDPAHFLPQFPKF